jgi:hypothetical protein
MPFPLVDSARHRARNTACFSSLLLVAVLACGGGTSEPRKETVDNPVPTLTGINPSVILAGSAATTLTVSGTGFVPGSQARWNNADRVTHYQSAQAITVDLPASDLANVTVGDLTVVNGAPGGGTSGSMGVPVGYPKPQITAISPTTTPIQTGTGALSITVTGTGFVPQSFVRLSFNDLGVSVTSSTQLVVSVPNSYLGTSGALPITVVNPGPGGGTSNAVDLGIIYAVPTLATAIPDSGLVGSAFTVTVTGTGFGTGSRVQWNGQDRPTTFVSATRLTADIPASDVPGAAVATLAVRSPAPGGGTSNSILFRVVVPAPTISSVNPGFVTAGAGSTTITISGANFGAGATAQWNGANRSATVVSSTSMTMTLTTADVATPQTGRITVTNPGASTSNTMSVGVVSSAPSLSVVRTVTLTHTDLVYDSLRSVLYASVPSNAAQYANEIVRIDPATGAVTGELAVGSNPATLAITDDDQYLYVALLGAPTIVRVTLATLSKDIDIPLPADSSYGEKYANDIVPIPGAPRTIAVATVLPSLLSPENGGTYLFDDATPRASSIPRGVGSNRITRGPTPSRIYGYDNESSEFGFRSLVVAADGLHEETVNETLLASYGLDIEYDGGFVYSTNGVVISVPAMSRAGAIPVIGYLRPDAANARVHFFNNNGPTIFTYHYSAFTSLGSFTNAALQGHKKLVRWGTDGLALGGGATIVLVRGTLVAQ